MPADCSKWTVVKQRKITTLRGLYAPICLGRAVSSVVEHYLDTVGVTGSNPVSRTISFPALQRLTHFHQNKRFDCNTFLPAGLIQMQASDVVFADDDGCLFVESEMSMSYWQPPGPFGGG